MSSSSVSSADAPTAMISSAWDAYRSSTADNEHGEAQVHYLAHKRLKIEHGRASPPPPPPPPPSYAPLSDRLPLHSGQQQQLIDRVSNRWMDEKHSYVNGQEDHIPGCCDLDEPESCPNVTYDVVTSRKFRRMVVVVFALMLALYFIWNKYIRLGWEEEYLFKEGFMDRGNGTYGVHRGGDYVSVKVHDLPVYLIPGNTEHDADGKRRLVFVGDVHGCRSSLLELLKIAGFNEVTDHLILTGDVLSKGPDSLGVIDELIRLNASSVRGNHEDRVLLAMKSHPHLLSLISTSMPNDEPAVSRGFSKDARLLRKLSKHHLEYLHSMPLVLRIPARTPPASAGKPKKGTYPLLEEILVVHAGLVPAVPLSRQDPFFIMNMRSINRHTHLPSATRDRGVPWYEVWNWYADRLVSGKSLRGFHDFLKVPEQLSKAPMGIVFKAIWRTVSDRFPDLRAGRMGKNRPKPRVVVYGHNHSDGLRLNRWTKGLDSGCVSGGKLTALIVNAAGEEVVVSVGCEDQRTP